VNPAFRPLQSRLPPWPRASLRTYLVAMILLATVPIVLLMSYQIFDDVRSQQRDLSRELQRGAGALALTIERELASSIDVLSVLSTTESLQRNDLETFEQTLRSTSRLRPSWSDVFLLDLEGRLLADTGDPADAADAAGPYDPLGTVAEFRRVASLRMPAVSNLLLRRQRGPHVTVITVPVVVNGAQRYLLGATIDASVWQRLIAHSTGADGFSSLLDHDGRVIAHSTQPGQFVGEALPGATRLSTQSRDGGFGRTQMLEGGSSYSASHAVAPSGWSVRVGVPAEPRDRAHNRAIVLALATAAGCLLLGVALALFFARRITRPLQQLATRGARGPYERIPVHEIALLRDALLEAAAQDAAAHDRLQRKADEFETLFHSSPIGLAFAGDAQCRVVMHNAAMDALFGPAALRASAAVQVLHRGEPLEPALQPLQRAAALGESVHAMDLEVFIEGRPPLSVLASAVPLRDANGRPRGAIGALLDITERKRAEARLLQADRRLRESQHLVDLAQEAGHVGFFHYQFITDVLTWTPGLVKLFGSATDGFESTLEDWIARMDAKDRVRVEQTLRLVVASRQDKGTLEYRVMLPEGSTRWLSSRILVSYAEDGQPQQLVGVTVDMTDQKQAEQSRAALVEREQAARLEAEAANRAKDEFLAMLGHELRNPLSAIASAVEVLNRVDARSDTAIDARRIIERQTRHLAHMMEDLLDVTRVISGKVLLSRQSVNLAALIERVAATLNVTGEARNHTLTVEAADVWIDADTTRIEQIFNNLLTNALKYTPHGGRISVAVRAVDGHAVLEVSDTGVGIAPSLLPRIFDLFVQGERTLDRRAGGLGVGLTLVRRLVELHGGTIRAESSGAGSTFTVRLPAIKAPVQAHEPRGTAPPRRRRVMLIEDNDDALQALRSMLELDGHTVSTATDGLGGLESVLAQRPDVAVVDIGLPGITGFDVARRSRAAGYAGRMIALSGYGQGRDVKQAMQAGFDAHLVKPVDAQQLRRLLNED
jgi:PAS domain S-box-containing protein